MSISLADVLSPALLLGVAAAIVHATFQIAVSTMTLLSSHTLGKKRGIQRLVLLDVGFIAGALTAVLFGLLALHAIMLVVQSGTLIDLWAMVAVVNVIAGLSAGFLYYRRQKGTVLWLPRRTADYFSKRAKAAKHPAEAYALGITSTLADLPFLVGPLSIIALLFLESFPSDRLIGFVLYAALSVLPLFFVMVITGSGRPISTTQRWREQNKNFLRYTAAVGSLLIALYIVVFFETGRSL